MREMKNSGIEWIGDIPSDWNYCKLKSYFDFEKGKNAALYTQEYIGAHIGEFPVYSGQTENNGIMGTIDTFDYDIEKCLFTTTVGAKVMTPKILKGKFNLSQNCLIMRAKKTSSIEFFYYALLPLFSYKKSLIPSYMQPSLRIEDLKTYGFFVPDISQQKKIAVFLDEKCAEIDTVIEKTKATIEEYKKLKQSVITQAVTKGIRPNRPMKDSGIEWIGEIPEKFNVVSLKYLCSMQAGKTLNSEQILPNGLYKVYGGNGERGYFNEFNNEGVYLLVGRQGALCGNVHRVSGKFWATEHAVVTTPSKYADINYLFYLLIAMNLNQYASNTAAQPGLSVNVIINKKCTLPNINEQMEIADYLDKKCYEIDELITKKTSLLSELESYKKSLIYEYVTGKKEV